MNNQNQNNFQRSDKLVPSPSERGWGEASQSSAGKPSPSERVSGDALNIGIVGAGGFAGFAAKAFLSISGINIIAITDINENVTTRMANDLNAKSYNNYESFLKDPGIDLVYIATPPFLHYQQSKQALLAGKHVICEKPAALKASEAEELRELASTNNLLYMVNLMQRYNPLYDVVDEVIKKKILGNFLHGFFENYASDENLAIDHWFWDETKSGGIFIEHGVHFFDMFSGWLGNGQVINALQIQRPRVDKKIIDRVNATVMYKHGAVNFYHGFDQPKILDRQEMRLLFERGEITLYEWVPVKMKLHGLITDEQLEFLKELIGECSIVYHGKIQHDQKVKGRFAEMIFDNEITLECGNVDEKQNRYRQLLINMLKDQWAWIKDHNHKRVIDEKNAIESLRIAEQATEIALKF